MVSVKRFVVLAVIGTLLVSGCLPFIPTEIPPAGDLQATAAALAGTLAVQTVQALPTPTLAPATETPTETPVLLPSPTQTATPDTTGTPTLTVTPGGPTATFTLTPTSTATPTATSGGLAFVPVDELPPGTKFSRVRIDNRSGGEVNVSLQCTTHNGYFTIIEFHFRHSLSADVPQGRCVYVVWVGGNKMVGSFTLGANRVILTINKDSVAVH